MRTFVRQHLTTIVVAAVTALIFGGGPPLAAVVFDADNARNADKVDQLHAVGAGATRAERAGKIVATNGSGRLPNNIIAKAPDADRLDGLNGPDYQRRVTGSCAANRMMTSVTAGGGVTCAVDDVDAAHTVVVSASGTPAQNGAALRQALDSIPSGTGGPTAAAPWVLKIGPGTFDLSPTGLGTRNFVHMSGAGAGTILRCHNCSDGVADPTLTVYDDVEVRSMVIRSTASATGLAHAMHFLGSGIVADVSVHASGGDENWGMTFVGGAPTIKDSTVNAQSAAGAQSIYAVWANGGDARFLQSDITASAGGGDALFARALYVTNGTVEVSNSMVAAPGIGNIYAAVKAPGANLRIATSMVNGLVTTEASAPTCAGAYDGQYVQLGSACQDVSGP